MTGLHLLRLFSTAAPAAISAEKRFQHVRYQYCGFDGLVEPADCIEEVENAPYVGAASANRSVGIAQLALFATWTVSRSKSSLRRGFSKFSFSSHFPSMKKWRVALYVPASTPGAATTACVG